MNFINYMEEKITLYKARLFAPLEPEGIYEVGLMVLIFWMVRLVSSNGGLYNSFLMWFGAALLVYGLCWEVYRLLFRILKTTSYGSVIFAISSSALIVSLSMVLAEHLINEATLTNPAYFPNSRNLIASLATPIVLASFCAAGLTLYYICLALTVLLRPFIRFVRDLSGRESTSSENSTVTFGRLAAAPMLAMLIVSGVEEVSASPGSSLRQPVKYIVAMADHYTHVQCNNISSEERYLMIDANLISVVSKTSEMEFSQRACISEKKL